MRSDPGRRSPVYCIPSRRASLLRSGSGDALQKPSRPPRKKQRLQQRQQQQRLPAVNLLPHQFLDLQHRLLCQRKLQCYKTHPKRNLQWQPRHECQSLLCSRQLPTKQRAQATLAHPHLANDGVRDRIDRSLREVEMATTLLMEEGVQEWRIPLPEQQFLDIVKNSQRAYHVSNGHQEAGEAIQHMPIQARTDNQYGWQA